VSVLGIYQDEPYKIIYEGREITLRFSRTSATTGRISWTLPKGAPGCTVDDLAYNGIVIIGDTVAIKIPDGQPVDGTHYTADTTLNPNQHAGDKIGTGLVVAALYDDKVTNFVDVTGLIANVPYYFGGFAVDNTLHYHGEGVHSYSLTRAGPGAKDGTQGFNLVQYGVQLTDITGLNSASVYTFSIYIDTDPTQQIVNPVNPMLNRTVTPFNISINGANAATYGALINEINKQFALIDGPAQSTTPPLANTVYFDIPNQKLYVWDGTQNIGQNPIFSATDPTTFAPNQLWVNPVNDHLSKFISGSFVLQTHLDFVKDPIATECGDFWYDQAGNIYRWDGSVWIKTTAFIQAIDPSIAPILPCGAYWFNPTTNLIKYWKDITGTCALGNPLLNGSWTSATAFRWATDPHITVANEYWFNNATNILYQRNSGNSAWVSTPVTINVSAPPNPAINALWLNPNTFALQQWNGTVWNNLSPIKVWNKDPVAPDSGDLWFDGTVLHVWNILSLAYVAVATLYIQTSDPSIAAVLTTDTTWLDASNHLFVWDGSQFVACEYISWPTDPRTSLGNGTYWHDIINNKWFVRTNPTWTDITSTIVFYNADPHLISNGEYWINGTNVSKWNGTAWVLLTYVTVNPIPPVGTLWFNTTTNTLMTWNGSTWIVATLRASVGRDGNGDLLFMSPTVGCESKIVVLDAPNSATLSSVNGLFSSTIPTGAIQIPIYGGDPVTGVSTTETLGIGTDGNAAHRREMIENILIQMGYPAIQVELTKEQLEFCIDQGIQYLRRHSSAAYDRVFFFLQLEPGRQHYTLVDDCVGFNKVVDVMQISRAGSSFLGGAEGQGVYGQVVLQHLYSMGTFDLLSYHIMNEYTELMEIMFAARIVFTWNETTRVLHIHQRCDRYEKVLLDAVIERTEQAIMQDRWCNNWVQTWATSEACQILAETRGKFQTLPGAGGGVALNSQALRDRAAAGFTSCLAELEDFIVNNVEDYGMGTSLVIG